MDDIRKYLSLKLTLDPNGKCSYGGVTPPECLRMIKKGLEDPKVKFMIEEMEKSGCSIKPNKFIRGARCQQLAGAFFSPGRGIHICCNNVTFQDEVTQGMIHELIHAYDECRGKNLDWSNCYHQACAEIRANVLSGDCHYLREYLRGHKNLRGHEPECVRRRATASVRSNPNCTESMTKMAVDAVWETCYNDTKPFDKAP
ncbi:Ku70-binding family protein [Perilla frutescens var. hirtella]|uniref:Mitochondrial inner membrane protease ATP23 n=1 Tax=Perilla frutescens var. hirtella TaxID=608512 RepID=A0AAD4IPE3_PERFH|nr:Ku70-binding family protein [Perilla frutescens var. hirtella]